MTQDTPAFFTLDRGTVSTSCALIAPVDGRYRMLASASAPVGLEPGSLLEDLAWRVARTDPSVAGSMEGWRDWSRLEVHTGRPPRGVLVAASEATGQLLERAYVGAGWVVTHRFFGPAPELIALGEAILEPELDAVVMGGREHAEHDEHDAARLLWPRVAALARLRDDVALIACGPFADRPEGILEHRLFSLPGPDRVPLTAETRLRQAAGQVGAHLVNAGAPMPADGRAALRTSIVSLAALLGERVDGIEVGAAAGSRTLAGADGEQRHAVIAAAGALRRDLLSSDELCDDTLRWSTLSGDPAGRMDELRELVLHPWSGVDRDGRHLRTALVRAAIERVEAAWSGADGDPTADAADVRVLVGGAWSALPPTAAALVVADGVRRPGAATLLHDHAHVLAPLGALPVEADRRRLLADLMDDCLLPLGASLLTGALRGKDGGAARVSVSSALGDQTLELETGQLQLVDLPPGIVARLDIDPLQGSVLGVEGRHLTLEVSGGLGGLLIDTRDLRLPLPEGGEPRRAQLEAWEATAWAGSER